MNKSVLTVLRHSQWPIMFGIAFSGAGLRATGRAFRYIQPTLGNTQWTGPAWPAQCLHSASKSSKSKWYQEEFAKLSFCRSGMGTSACEVSCNDESRWESKSRSHGKRWAKRFERKQLEVYFFLCLWILWRWTQHLPSTSKYYKYFFCESYLWKFPISSNSVDKPSDKRRSVIFLWESGGVPPHTSQYKLF